MMTIMARRGFWLIALLSIALIIGGCSLGALIPGMGTAPVVYDGNEYEVVIPSSDGELSAHVASQLIVKLVGDVSADEIADEIGAVDYEPIFNSDALIDSVVLTLPSGMSVVDAWRQLDEMSGVEYAEPNYIFQLPDVERGGLSSLSTPSAQYDPLAAFPNDPRYSRLQWGPGTINAEAAWGITTGSEDVVIAILDTGVDLDHVDFQGKIIGGYNAVDPNQDPTDVNGHGTHVAGIAAARGNDGIGMAGIAWESPILAVKVLGDDGSGSTLDIIDGIQWTIDWAKNNPDKRVVINMSLGGPGYSRLFKEVIDRALSEGIVVVAAMGNSYSRAFNFPGAHQGVIAVGATDANDKLAPFSTKGRFISVVAPGVRIDSAIPGGDKYDSFNGTSMASPHVAGAAALLLAMYPEMSPAEVKSVLERTAVHPKGDGHYDERFGHGRIDVEAALKAEAATQYGQVVVRVTDQGGNPIPYDTNVILIDPDGEVISSELAGSLGDAVFWFVPPETGYTAEVTLLIPISGQYLPFTHKVEPFFVTKGYKEIRLSCNMTMLPIICLNH